MCFMENYHLESRRQKEFHHVTPPNPTKETFSPLNLMYYLSPRHTWGSIDFRGIRNPYLATENYSKKHSSMLWGKMGDYIF